MSLAAATVASVVLAALAVLQVLVAAGRPYGRLVWGGGHEVLPRSFRIASAVSVAVYAGIAALLLWQAEVWGPPPPAVGVATWVLVGYFTLGVAANAISHSRPERAVMTPVAVVLTLCCLALAVS